LELLPYYMGRSEFTEDTEKTIDTEI